MANDNALTGREAADLARLRRRARNRALYGSAYAGLSAIAARAAGCERRSVAVAYPGTVFSPAAADPLAVARLPREHYTAIKCAGVGRA